MNNNVLMNLGIIGYDTRIELMQHAKEEYDVFDIVGRTLIRDAFGHVGVSKFMIYDQEKCTLRPVSALEYYDTKFYKHAVIVNRDKESKHLKFHVLTNVELIDAMFDMTPSTWKMNISSRTAGGGENIECGDMFEFEASKTFDSAYEAMRYIQSGIVDSILTYSDDSSDNFCVEPEDLYKMPGM